MFIEHVDQLRCTADHEESWLVASIARREERFIVEGTLGCPVCRRLYPIIGGVVYFGAGRGQGVQGSAPDGRSGIEEKTHDSEEALRVAAFLNAAERSALVLAGAWGEHGHAVAEMIPLTVFVLNPRSPAQSSARVAVIESSEGIPLARDAMHGVALDRYTATPVNVATALKVLKAGGRLVAPAELAPPPGITILARDETYWVGEKVGDITPLRRA